MYMGATGSSWMQTLSSQIAAALHPKLKGDHDALHDAQYQAELFLLIRQGRQSIVYNERIERYFKGHNHGRTLCQ